MLELLFSLIAGMLTVLAPCVLPLLPVIVGGSFTGKHDKKRPYLVAGGLVSSIILFTLLLKTSTTFINVDQSVWTSISGGIVIILGLVTLFPKLWDTVIGTLGIQTSSQGLLGKATRNTGPWAAVLTGAALGPVFSSCSPTYAWIIANAIQKTDRSWVLNLIVYSVGLSIMLLAISLIGRKFLDKIKWLSNPHGTAQKVIGILFILVGLSIVSGYDKKIQTYLVEKNLFNLNSFEEKLVPKDEKVQKAPPKPSSRANAKELATLNDPSVFNVNPYAAPEITGIQEWINSEPLTLAGLKGKVVLVDFWTYSCINCIRTLPYVEKWYETYKDQGLVVIAMHAPEFAFEKIPENVNNAVAQHKLTYPIGLDNDFKTWRAFQNQYWPASYLVDKDGNVRREHFGEGEYMESEAAIRALLAERGSAELGAPVITNDPLSPSSQAQTPETYLGSLRAARQAANLPAPPNSNQWAIDENWKQDSEGITSTGSESKLQLRFTGKKVFLVMSSEDGTSKTAKIMSGEPLKPGIKLVVEANTLYEVFSGTTIVKDELIEITVPAGIKAYAFTFES